MKQQHPAFIHAGKEHVGTVVARRGQLFVVRTTGGVEIDLPLARIHRWDDQLPTPKTKTGTGSDRIMVTGEPWIGKTRSWGDADKVSAAEVAEAFAKIGRLDASIESNQTRFGGARSNPNPVSEKPKVKGAFNAGDPLRKRAIQKEIKWWEPSEGTSTVVVERNLITETISKSFKKQ